MKGMLLVVCALVMVAGCGYREGRLQPHEQGYLSFIGNLSNIQVFVDGAANPIVLARETRPSGVAGELYAVAPGPHRVRVYRDGQVVVDRVVVVGDQTTLEVQVP